MGSLTLIDFDVHEVPGKGNGLFSKQSISANTVIGVFDGFASSLPLVDAINYDRSLWIELSIIDEKLFFLDHVGPLEGVELMNHSCDPNCKIENLIIYTIKPISPGDELTLDYSPITKIPLGIKCKCSDNCKNYL